MRAQSEFNIPNVQGHLFGRLSSLRLDCAAHHWQGQPGWRAVPPSCSSPQPKLSCHLVSPPQGTGKTLCPFHLSFLMTAESVWGLGGKFLLIPSYPPTSTEQICRDCRHEIHLNMYEKKNNLMGQNLFPGRENQTTLLKSVGNCLHEQKLFTEVQTGAKSHFPLVLFEFL